MEAEREPAQDQSSTLGQRPDSVDRVAADSTGMRANGAPDTAADGDARSELARADDAAEGGTNGPDGGVNDEDETTRKQAWGDVLADERVPGQISPTETAIDAQMASEETARADGHMAAERPDSDSDSEGTVSEEEPVLKYSRLVGPIEEAVKREALSAVAVSAQYAVFGSHNGVLHVYSHDGAEIVKVKAHSATIHDISIDFEGENVCTASLDGNVVVFNVRTREAHKYSYSRPVRCVAIDPMYSAAGSRRFACGGMAGKLIMHEKSWLGQKDAVLHSGQGPILELKWNNEYLSWADDAGVHLFNISTGTRAFTIDRSERLGRADLNRCRLHWARQDLLIVGWANTISFLRLHRPEGQAAVKFTIERAIQTDAMVSGLCMMQEDLIVLAYCENETDSENDDAQTIRSVASGKRSTRTQHPPEIRIINSANEEVSNDAVQVRDYQHLVSNDYSLAFLKQTRAMYILSPRDVVMARPRDEYDHVEWLVEQGQYDEALNLAGELASAKETRAGARRPVISVAEIREKCMLHFVQEGRFSYLAKHAKHYLAREKSLWEKAADILLEKAPGTIPLLMPRLPIADPQLDAAVYDRLLDYCAEHNTAALKAAVMNWSRNIYNRSRLISKMEVMLDDDASSSSRDLCDSLADLYLEEERFQDALPLILESGRTESIPLIEKYNLYEQLGPHIYEFLSLGMANDKEDGPNLHALDLLVSHAHAVSPKDVLAQLEAHPRYAYHYLERLVTQHPDRARPLTEAIVSKFAEYNVPLLLEYLRGTDAYDLDYAYSIASQHNLVEPQVYLLSRMGRNADAVMLLLRQEGDEGMRRAVDFVKHLAQNRGSGAKNQDTELWNILIGKAAQNAQSACLLIESIGTSPVAVEIVRRLQSDIQLKDVRESLLMLLRDFSSLVRVTQCGTDLHTMESNSLSARLRKGQRRGKLVNIAREYPEQQESRDTAMAKTTSNPSTVAPDGTVDAAASAPMTLQSERSGLVVFFDGPNVLPGELQDSQEVVEETLPAYTSLGAKISHIVLLQAAATRYLERQGKLSGREWTYYGRRGQKEIDGDRKSG